MNNRTMIKLSASEDCITLRTLSKDCHSPQGFVLTEKELLELEEKRYMTVSDIRSFAKVSLRKSFEQAEILEIEFTWLSDAGGGKVSGRTETVRLSYEKFKSSIMQSREDGMQIKMLSLEEDGRPKIEFQSRRNLKAVAETKALRKKLGKFLADHFENLLYLPIHDIGKFSYPYSIVPSHTFHLCDWDRNSCINIFYFLYAGTI